MSEAIEPYQPLRTLAPGLHVVDGEWGPLGRRMTVMDVGDGALALHSAIRMREADLQKLEALGRVRWILVPNPEHSTDAGFYAARYPGAKVLVPAEGKAALAKAGVPIHGTHDHDWPKELMGKLERAPLRGLRWNPEVVFLHVASKTLVVCDLAFHFAAADLGWAARQLMRLNGAVDAFGPTRFFRSMIIVDKKKLADSLYQVWSWDFERVVVSHGRVLENHGKERLRASCAFLSST